MDWSWSTVYLLTEWMIRIGTLIYVPQERSPNAARAWLLLIFFLPLPGLILYAWVGRIHLPRERLQLVREAAEQITRAENQLLLSNLEDFQPFSTTDPRLQHHIGLVTALGEFPVAQHNQLEIFTGYERLLERIMADIRAAQHSIHLIYYIYGNDKTGQRFTNALCAAARRGVSVRVLLDAVGAYHGLKYQAPQLRAAGIEVHESFPVSLLHRNAARLDLRNHRKIAIIDGKVAHIGSLNLVDPTFIPGFPNEELNLRITGLAVCQLQAVFLADWYIETHHPLQDAEISGLFQIPPHDRTKNTGSAAQVLPSGPGYGKESIRDVMIALIYASVRKIGITTPYFIPDEPFLVALIIAARRGVQVQLIVPERSNHAITNWAQQSYFDQLLQEGVEIYLYRPGLLHAKHMVYDEQVALVGSPNIDVRSFTLNAEIGLVIYDQLISTQLQNIQHHYIEKSTRLTIEEWQRRPLRRKIVSNLARMADALL